MMLKHFLDISTSFRFKKKLKRVLLPSIEMSMANSWTTACVINSCSLLTTPDHVFFADFINCTPLVVF